MEKIKKNICKRLIKKLCQNLQVFTQATSPNGGAEIASTGKCRYGKLKYKVAKCVRVENTSTENSGMVTQAWKT